MHTNINTYIKRQYTLWWFKCIKTLWKHIGQNISNIKNEKNYNQAPSPSIITQRQLFTHNSNAGRWLSEINNITHEMILRIKIILRAWWRKGGGLIWNRIHSLHTIIRYHLFDGKMSHFCQNWIYYPPPARDSHQGQEHPVVQFYSKSDLRIKHTYLNSKSSPILSKSKHEETPTLKKTPNLKLNPKPDVNVTSNHKQISMLWYLRQVFRPQST